MVGVQENQANNTHTNRNTKSDRKEAKNMKSGLTWKTMT